jgi:general secretion pathway protein G
MAHHPLDDSPVPGTARSRAWAYAAPLLLIVLPLPVILPGECRTQATIDRVGRQNANFVQAMLSKAIDEFRKDCGRYPTAAEGIEPLYRQPPDVTGWRGPYQVRHIDPWGRAFLYVPPPTVGSDAYQLVSSGPDGTRGTPDDVVATGPAFEFRPVP